MLEKILKPPFRGGHSSFRQLYDGNSNCLMQISDEFIKSFPYSERFEIYSLLRDFVVKALNEKWDRDYGELMRWERSNSGTLSYQCPKCKNWFGAWSDFCLSCGQRLLSPEESSS